MYVNETKEIIKKINHSSTTIYLRQNKHFLNFNSINYFKLPQQSNKNFNDELENLNLQRLLQRALNLIEYWFLADNFKIIKVVY